MGLSTNLISGLASGFDWRSMIDELMKVERRPVDLVETRKREYEEKLTEWQSVNTKLLSLKAAAEGLTDPEDFYLYSTGMSSSVSTVDAEDLLSVSTTSTAAPGTYTVKVTSLAQAQKLSSNPFTSRTVELGSSYAGEIIINGKVITISATDSLSDVASSINNANTGTDPSGVSAGIVNYGTNDYRLILTSDATGAQGISLLNGSSTNLVQKYGWKDNQSAVIKNSITNGAQSDRFTAPNVAISALLGLSTGESGDVTIGDQTVTLNLSSMSLNGIKDAINTAAPTGVTASVISQTVDGTAYYRLQIEGTETFADTSNILNTLGVLDHNSAVVTGKVSTNSMTANGAYITPDTILVDIDGYISYTQGPSPPKDKIVMTGTKTGAGGSVNFDFEIETATTVGDLLSAIETQYAGTAGDVIAYVTSDGKIRVDDVAGAGNLEVILADSITNGELEFVDDDLAFGAASDRNRQIVAGDDATVEVDGVEVTDASNIIDDVIAGVTLNLVGTDDTATVTLTVARDIDAVKAKITGFVAKYNEVMSYINTQFSYDEESETTGGILFGDGTLNSVKSNLTSVLTRSIWGVDSDFSCLALIGIENEIDTNDVLTLSIDDSTLTGYLQTNFNDVMSLFVAQGVTDTSNLSYIGHSRDTEPYEYAVQIDTVATRSTSTSDHAVSGQLGDAETLTITEGGKIATIELTSGMYIDDIVNEINTELDTEYTQILVGDQKLYADDQGEGGGNYITSGTTWDSIYDSGGTLLGLEDEDIITFSGTSRTGGTISGSYQIDMDSGTVQDLLSAIENAFSRKVAATLDTSGRIVVTDKYVGTSQLSITSISHPDENEFFGTVDVDSGGSDGSQQGCYAIPITASKNESNNLILTHDDYGSDHNFTIARTTTLLWDADQNVDNGVDVAGKIGGETATGSGQVLTGDDGNTNTDGLAVRYTGTATGTNVGTITLTRGVAELFEQALYNMTDDYEGYVAFKQDSLQDRINDFDDQIKEMEDRLDRKMEAMINRFVAMEVALSRIKNQSDWLTGQINAIYSGWV
jgi:flagellar hook-associated protein 2